MTSPLGPSSLKCVAASSTRRRLREIVQQTLRQHVGDEDVRHLHDSVFLVYTEADTATIRDWLAATLADGESAFVVEFERWSACGPAVDTTWLNRRGH